MLKKADLLSDSSLKSPPALKHRIENTHGGTSLKLCGNGGEKFGNLSGKRSGHYSTLTRGANGKWGVRRVMLKSHYTLEITWVGFGARRKSKK